MKRYHINKIMESETTRSTGSSGQTPHKWHPKESVSSILQHMHTALWYDIILPFMHACMCTWLPHPILPIACSHCRCGHVWFRVLQHCNSQECSHTHIWCATESWPRQKFSIAAESLTIRAILMSLQLAREPLQSTASLARACKQSTHHTPFCCPSRSFPLHILEVLSTQFEDTMRICSTLFDTDTLRLW